MPSDEKVSALGALSPANIAAEFPVIQPGNLTDNFRINIAQSLGFTGRMYLASNAGAGAISIIVQSLTSGVSAEAGWVVIDPYTIECEIRKVTGISGNQLTIAALTYSHVAFDSVFWVDSGLVNVEWFGAKFDGVTDDTIAFERAFAASDHVVMPIGTTVISSVLDPSSNSVLKGMGTALTIINASGIVGPAMYAPGQESVLDGFKIVGDNTGGSYGIMTDDGHRPLRATWGSIKIDGFEIGLNITATSAGNGIFMTNFGRVFINGCTTGLRINSAGVPIKINANSFIHLAITNCTTGMLLDRVQGLTIGFLLVETGTTGIAVVNGISILIFGGWIEGFVTNIDIADNPDVINFVYMGLSDDVDTNYNYNYSANRSDLLAFSSGGSFYRMGGRWFFDQLERGAGGGFIDRPNLRGYSIANTVINAGATISVAERSLITLDYLGAQAITDLINQDSHQIVTLMANNNLATIADAGNFLLSAAWNPVNAGDNITLLFSFALDKWIELSRTFV